MKKFIGLFFIVYFVLQINNSSYGQDDRWVYIGKSSDQVEYYVDKKSILCDSWGNLIAWGKINHLNGLTKWSYGQMKLVDFVLVRFILHRDRYYEEIERFCYYVDGGTDSYRLSNSDGPIIPGTMNELIFDYLFSNYSCSN